MQFENVTLKSRQLALLKRFKDHFVTITVVLPDSHVEYTSAILGIRPENDYLILDELKPEEGHQRFLETRECTIELYYRGEGIRFTSPLLSKGMKDDIAFYKVGLPKSIHYYLQRKSYRVPITLTETMPIHIRSQDQELIEGEIVDLSSGGVGFRVPRTPWTETMKQGDQIAWCKFALNTGEAVNCALQIRFASLSKDKAYMRIGAKFIDLEKGQIKMLERYIVTLDRERRKSLAKV
jgi:c-di-GMP-binding flagellar brake protein YcgR